MTQSEENSPKRNDYIEIVEEGVVHDKHEYDNEKSNQECDWDYVWGEVR